ncbi:hypothetical protein HCG49_04115 [Arenibacter sp. 6A1]|uniref:hypothetical protein n=1 Tax=Arenibacter sp. 6A1 TaxID=2720391 RepID=UPI0014486134|nr:hypothetical protein [Arenibacter sp. 6A1]NKI25742.1 hypothetical protein [Arenibacter sp. 6A1]
MENGPTTSDYNEILEAWHWDLQQWKSKLQAMEEEVVFLDRLLHSNVFVRNTPTHYEKIYGFLKQLKKVSSYKTRVRSGISRYENKIGNIISTSCDKIGLRYYQKHDRLKAEITMCLEDFRLLKYEVLLYTGKVFKNP